MDAERVAACQLDGALHHLGDAASVDVLHREHVDARLADALALAVVEIAKSDDDRALGIHLRPEAANRRQLRGFRAEQGRQRHAVHVARRRR